MRSAAVKFCVQLFYGMSLIQFLIQIAAGDVTFQTLVLSAVWIITAAVMWHKGIIGGADCKVFFALAVLIPDDFIILLCGTLFIGVVYAAAGRIGKIKDFFKIGDGIPLLSCLAIVWMLNCLIFWRIIFL